MGKKSDSTSESCNSINGSCKRSCDNKCEVVKTCSEGERSCVVDHKKKIIKEKICHVKHIEKVYIQPVCRTIHTKEKIICTLPTKYYVEKCDDVKVIEKTKCHKRKC